MGKLKGRLATLFMAALVLVAVPFKAQAGWPVSCSVNLYGEVEEGVFEVSQMTQQMILSCEYDEDDNICTIVFKPIVVGNTSGFIRSMNTGSYGDEGVLDEENQMTISFEANVESFIVREDSEEEILVGTPIYYQVQIGPVISEMKKGYIEMIR